MLVIVGLILGRGAMMNKIALLNDEFRTTFSGGKIMMTAGVNALPDMVKATRFKRLPTSKNSRTTTIRIASTISAASNS